MNAAYRRMEIVSILVVSGHVTARELAQEFGVCTRTTTRSLPMNRKGSKKCMMWRKGKIKKSSNVSLKNTGHTS